MRDTFFMTNGSSIASLSDFVDSESNGQAEAGTIQKRHGDIDH